LTFNKIGLPQCSSLSPDEAPKVGPSYHWLSSKNVEEVTSRGPFSSTKDFIKFSLDTVFDVEKIIKEDGWGSMTPLHRRSGDIGR
jgi:hypothetical protein